MFRNVNVVKKTETVTKPRRDDDGVLVLYHSFYELDDGKVIEYCVWTDMGMTFTDIIVPKSQFNLESEGSFEEYLIRRGVSLPDETAQRHRTCTETEDGYMVQYTLI